VSSEAALGGTGVRKIQGDPSPNTVQKNGLTEVNAGLVVQGLYCVTRETVGVFTVGCAVKLRRVPDSDCDPNGDPRLANSSFEVHSSSQSTANSKSSALSTWGRTATPNHRPSQAVKCERLSRIVVHNLGTTAEWSYVEYFVKLYFRIEAEKKSVPIP
jgi:hypothetical protein